MTSDATRPRGGYPGRTVLVVAHTGRPSALDVAQETVRRLSDAGITVRLLASEAADLKPVEHCQVVPAGIDAAHGCEVVVVIGGDGTILRSAELTRHSGTPLLGVNLGHIGFLAEAEVDDLDVTVEHVVHRAYHVEERMTLDVLVRKDGEVVAHEWAHLAGYNDEGDLEGGVDEEEES